MSKQLAPQQSRPAQTQTQDPAALLDQILEQQPTQRYRAIDAALSKRIELLEELLPDQMKGQGARLVKRAMLTFSRSESLQECTPESFIRCVLQAAECGLAIDGKLAHAVPYNNKVKVNGRDEWRKEAQFQPDFKGLIAVAKRTKQIKDCYGDVVCQNDHFVHGRSGGDSRLEHSYDPASPRGDVIAAYAVIKLSDGDWRYELMQIHELDAIQNRSKAEESRKKGYIKATPWTTDTNQMRIKTVIKRGLKLYCDDPGLTRAIELDDADFDGEPIARGPQKRVAVSPLNQSLNVPVAPKQSTFERTMDNGMTYVQDREHEEHVPLDPIGGLDVLLSKCTTLGDVNDLETELIEVNYPPLNDDQRTIVRSKCDAARQAIRGSRGERSNQREPGDEDELFAKHENVGQ